MSDKKSISSARNLHLEKLLEKIFSLPEMPQIDRWLSLEFSKNKKFGSRDRKWYAEQIFSIVRNLYSILYHLKYQNSDLATFANEIKTSKKFWENLTVIPELIRNPDFFHPDSGSRVKPGMTTMKPGMTTVKPGMTTVNSDMTKTESLDMNFIQASVPLWLKPYLTRAFPDTSALQHFLNLQNTRPALWIRLNHSEKRNDVLNDLKANEFDVQTTSNENTLAVTGEKSIYQLQSFQNGLFEIQDYASQEIGHAMHVQPGEYIWDACAGGGGKTMQIAGMLKNKGVVYATDIRAYKLEEIKRRAKRAQFFNVRTMEWDGNTLPQFPKEIQNRKGFNTILVDAPCSASGTWRRHPDAKYKTDKYSINELTELQFKILSSVQGALKQNGKNCLCYL